MIALLVLPVLPEEVIDLSSCTLMLTLTQLYTSRWSGAVGVVDFLVKQEKSFSVTAAGGLICWNDLRSS